MLNKIAPSGIAKPFGVDVEAKLNDLLEARNKFVSVLSNEEFQESTNNRNLDFNNYTIKGSNGFEMKTSPRNSTETPLQRVSRLQEDLEKSVKSLEDWNNQYLRSESSRLSPIFTSDTNFNRPNLSPTSPEQPSEIRPTSDTLQNEFTIVAPKEKLNDIASDLPTTQELSAKINKFIEAKSPKIGSISKESNDKNPLIANPVFSVSVGTMPVTFSGVNKPFTMERSVSDGVITKPTASPRRYIPAERLAYLRNRVNSLPTPRTSNSLVNSNYATPVSSTPNTPRKTVPKEIRDKAHNMLSVMDLVKSFDSVSSESKAQDNGLPKPNFSNSQPKQIQSTSSSPNMSPSFKGSGRNYTMKHFANLGISSGVSISNIFICTIKHLFEGKIQTIRDVSDINRLSRPHHFLNSILGAFQEYPGSPELEFIFDWLITNHERVLTIIEEKSVETCLAFLVLDLLNYYDDELRSYEARKSAAAILPDANITERPLNLLTGTTGVTVISSFCTYSGDIPKTWSNQSSSSSKNHRYSRALKVSETGLGENIPFVKGSVSKYVDSFLDDEFEEDETADEETLVPVTPVSAPPRIKILTLADVEVPIVKPTSVPKEIPYRSDFLLENEAQQSSKKLSLNDEKTLSADNLEDQAILELIDKYFRLEGWEDTRSILENEVKLRTKNETVKLPFSTES